MKKISLIIPFLGIIFSCNTEPEQTVETAYVNPYFLPENLKYKIPVKEIKLRYKFERNGISNVDYLDCSLLKEPLDNVLRRLKNARIFYKDNYTELMGYYKEGVYHIKPEQEVATSELHKKDKSKIKKDLLTIIDKSAQISGYLKSEPSSIRNREAIPGQTGYIGYSIGDPNVAFVDEKGIILLDAFQGIIQGAVYLDKILNYHLDQRFLDDENLRSDHENIVLPAGRNYTELEHHWDMAYGYFGFLENLAQPEGIPALKYSEQKLYNAFVQGRIELSRYRYDDMKVQLKIIREELSRVIAIRVINYLSGVNTIANLKEGNGSDAFVFLSKAYGLIYAMQFTRKANGDAFFTYNQVQAILNKLRQRDGFWNSKRLLQGDKGQGSVKNIAKEIAKPFGFTIEQVTR